MSYVSDLISYGDRLFGKREDLLSFWQHVAEQFSPATADFVATRTLGEDYASDLMTSYPLLVAREMIGSFGTMLRPSTRPAAVMYVDDLEDHEGKRWLEWATKRMNTFMHDKASQYIIAAKDGEHDFALFGQAVLTVERRPDRSGLLFRSWHLRDTAWADDVTGQVECVHRKWKPTAQDLLRTFRSEGKLHAKVREQLQPGKDRYCEITCRHVVIPAEQWEGPEKFRTPLVSVYIDVDNEHVMEATGARSSNYVIPRWQRIKGAQYATSPAVTCALPEARLLQAMTYTLLEAGEKATNPPLLATKEMIRGDIDVRAGGITWVAAEYDERMGGVLRPLAQDKTGMPLGLELQQRSEDMLRKAFYADKLSMPARGDREETAYEVGQRVQQYIRDALPLVEPVEIEFNGGVWERAFDVAMTDGWFGPPDSIPPSLRGAEVEFKFSSPLRETTDANKGRVFLDGVQLLQAGAAIDPAVSSIPNAVEAMRDVLSGIGWQEKWMRSEEAVAAAAQDEANRAQAEAMLGAMTQASQVVKNIGGAATPPADMAI